MRVFITIIFSVVIAGCCIQFEEYTSGTEFNVGDIITSCDTRILVEQFQWQNGTWSSTGTAKIHDQNYAKGSGNDLNARNVNLNFKYNYPLDKITFKFGELGGNINLKINGDFRNINDLVTLNGNTVGNVSVTINATQDGNNWYGDARLEGTINEFVIGGQELWLDNICPCN